jgi:arylsulfatase A-like enzyme
MNKSFFTFLFLLLLFNSCVNDGVDQSSPNIIVILSDDQGWGDLRFTGNTSIHTPNIDLLAHNGVSFNQFYVAPVCSPTRAEFLTGRYAFRSGVFHTSEGGEMMNLDETTIADVFKSAGYATAAFGKWHNGMQYPYHPNGRGFDEFYGFCSGHWGEYFDAQMEHNGQLVNGSGYMPDDLTTKALEFMENNRNNLFFLYLPLNTPHSPMQVPDEWFSPVQERMLLKPYLEPEKEDIVFTQAALAMCENIDMNVGRIMEKLKKLNLLENTIVIYFIDNGPNGVRWNGKMKGIKGSTDEGGVRSPLFIHWPATIKKSKEINEISAAIDLLPTLADLAGLKVQINKPLDGVSLKSLILDEGKEVDSRFIFSHWNGRTSVRSQKYRLDHLKNLYDMDADPGQQQDISKEEPEVAEIHLNALKKWNEELEAFPINKKRLFPVGHLNFKYTQLPARDAKAEGGIVRSNRYPNCSFYTNWTNTMDRIYWEIEVLNSGFFDVEVYYTCPAADIGATIELSFGDHKTSARIVESHDPPLRGMENDRVVRIESYVKDFKPLHIGTIYLEKGVGQLSLRATEVPGQQAMDFRLLMLTKKTSGN